MYSDLQNQEGTGECKSEVEQLYSTRHCGVVKTDTQHQASLAELRTRESSAGVGL